MKNATPILAALCGCWAGLVVLNYVQDPLHLTRFSIVRDAVRIWSHAPLSTSQVLAVLPGHLWAMGSVVAGVGLAWLAGAGPLAWFAAEGLQRGAGMGSLRLALGMGMGLLALFGSGLVGLFAPEVFYPGAIAVAAVGWWTARKAARQSRKPPAPAAASLALAPAWVVAAAVGLAVISALVNVLGALAPETGYDSLIQHLADPRNYLAAHRVYFNDFSFLSQHPAGIQMLYAWLLPVGGDAGAKLLHAAFAVMVSWAFGSYIRKFFGAADALLLACVLYLTPFNGILSARAYVDHGLTFYCAAALLAPWGSCLQGAMIGLAIGTKYVGGFLLIGWMVVLAVTGRRRGAWNVAVAASLFAICWGLRNWLNTGNLVYPFGYSFLGGLGWDAHSAGEYAGELVGYGKVSGLAEHLAIPWLAVVHDRGALDDGSLGPLYLMLVPLVFLATALRIPATHVRACRTLLVLSLVLWGLWLLSPRQVRYALVLLPPTLALLAFGMKAAQHAWPQSWRAVVSILPVILFVQLMISLAALYLWVNPIYVVAGVESPLRYLTRIMEPRDPQTGLSQYMDLVHRLPLVLSDRTRTYMLGDAKVYYLPGRWVVNALFNPPLLARIVRRSATPHEVAKGMRQRGVTHILYNVGGSVRIEFTHHMFHWNDREFVVLESFARTWLKPVARYETSEGDPAYLLYELSRGQYPDPQYLPGLDTRIAAVDSSVAQGNLVQARDQAEQLEREYPSSSWLRARLKAAWKLAPSR